MVKYHGLKLGYPKKQLYNNDDVASITLFDDYILSYYPKVEVELFNK